MKLFIFRSYPRFSSVSREPVPFMSAAIDHGGCFSAAHPRVEAEVCGCRIGSIGAGGKSPATVSPLAVTAIIIHFLGYKPQNRNRVESSVLYSFEELVYVHGGHKALVLSALCCYCRSVVVSARGNHRWVPGVLGVVYCCAATAASLS